MMRIKTKAASTLDGREEPSAWPQQSAQIQQPPRMLLQEHGSSFAASLKFLHGAMNSFNLSS